MLVYSADSPYSQARREHAYRLRKEGLTLAAIGVRLGVTGSRVGSMIWRYERRKKSYYKPAFYFGNGVSRKNEADVLAFLNDMEKCYRPIDRALAKYNRLRDEHRVMIDDIMLAAEKKGIGRDTLERLWRNHRQNERLRAKKSTKVGPTSGQWTEV